PRALRTAFAQLLSSVPPHRWDGLFHFIGRFLPRRYRLVTPGAHIHKLASVIDVVSPEEMYFRLTSHWHDPSSVIINSIESPTTVNSHYHWDDIDDFVDVMMYLDTITYLPND